MLTHAITRWPAAINFNLWPYAMRAANDMHSTLPLDGKEKSPIEIFSGMQIRRSIRHHHPFSCPFYILDRDLQAIEKSEKWKDRARVGINLGYSP